MITITIDAKGSKRMLNRIEKRIPGMKKRILTEMGMKTKNYAKQNVQMAGAVASGTLLRSIHRRTSANDARIWTDAGHAASWETGMRPHFIHRSMISYAGYTVGEWMNSKGMSPRRNYLLVGAGTPIGKGTHFMRDAFRRIRLETPTIMEKHARNMLK